jgi:hypothetical protein
MHRRPLSGRTNKDINTEELNEMSLKPNLKALGTALIVAFAFAAVAASAAQATAPRFTVGGSTSFSKTTFTGSSEGAVKLENPSRNLKLESPTSGNCTTHGFLTSSGAGEPSTLDEVTLTCTNAHTWIGGVDRTAICPAHSTGGAANGTIVTTDLDARLVWTAATGDASVGVTFTPEPTSNAFAHIEITGATCPLNTGASSLTVAGNVIATNDTPTTVDAKVQKLNFPATADTKYWTNQTLTRTEDTDPGLTLGETAATFVGTFAIHLTGEPTWGIEPG